MFTGGNDFSKESSGSVSWGDSFSGEENSLELEFNEILLPERKNRL